MTQTSKTLVFFGNERLSTGFEPNGAPTLQALIDNGYDIRAVISHFTPGTSRTARKLEIEEVAIRHNVPILLPSRLKDIQDELVGFNAIAGVLVAYGKIIPQDIIDIFPRGIINIHPSLLPLRRGSTPIEQTILDGATQAGVSIMDLAKEMDAGPVFAQTPLELIGTETKQDLTASLLALGSQLLIDCLPSILDGSLTGTPQDKSKATYTSLLSKQAGIMDLKKTAIQLEREVRAFQSWPKSRTTVFGHSITVTRAAIANNTSPQSLTLPCAGNTFLEITQLIAPSGKTMSGEAFLRGYAH